MIPDPTLGLTLPVKTQLIDSDAGVCVEATFASGDVKKNDRTQFKAKGQP